MAAASRPQEERNAPAPGTEFRLADRRLHAIQAPAARSAATDQRDELEGGEEAAAPGLRDLAEIGRRSAM